MIETVIPLINRTITKEGSYQFHVRCKQFISDETTLKNRQNVLTTLAANSTQPIETILNELKDSEKAINTWVNSIEYSRYAGPIDNPHVINVTNYGQISSGFIVFIFYALLYYAANKTGKDPITIKSYIKSLFLNMLDISDMLLSAFTPLHTSWIYNISFVFACMYVLSQIYMFGLNINSSYNHYVKSCKYIDTYYVPLLVFMERIEKLIKLDNFSGLAQNALKQLDVLRMVYKHTLTFGEVVLLHKNYHYEFTTLLMYMGTIDEYIACVKLLREDYVLPKFVHGTRPVLRISNMWHPELVKTQQKNSVNFGEHALQILTAPNKAGKSTYMKTALVNVWLAQTLGVCPARKIRLTPFYSTFWYLNIPDTLGRESLFEAELKRCYDIYKTILDNPTLFYFGIIDELFTGTNPHEGEASTYAIIKNLAENSNSLFILSTHFNQLTDKIKANHCCFYAYEKSGQYEFDYILRKGTNKQHIALGLLKEIGFDDTIINTAQTALKIIYNKD